MAAFTPETCSALEQAFDDIDVKLPPSLQEKGAPSAACAAAQMQHAADALACLTAAQMCNNYMLKAGELANKWEALVLKKHLGAINDENLLLLEGQVCAARPSSPRQPRNTATPGR
jgi:hypothetical protein